MSPDERRADLTDVTLRLLRVHGREVTTRQIAEAAGIAEGTIFRAFASKDELVDAAISRAFEPGDLVVRIEEIDASLPLRERLVVLVSILQQRFRATFDLMQKMGLVATAGPPARRRGRGRLAGAARWPARRRGGRRRRPARRTRCDEFVHVLRLLTFAGSHEQDRRRTTAHPRGDRRHRPVRTPEERLMLLRLLRERLGALPSLARRGRRLPVPRRAGDALPADAQRRHHRQGHRHRRHAATSSAPARIMLAVAFGQIICSVVAVRFGSRTAMSVGPRPACLALPPGRNLLDPRGAAVRRAVAHHADAPTTCSRCRCWC